MKKTIIIVVIVGMLGWAVYDFIANPNETASPGADDKVQQEKSDVQDDQGEFDSTSNQEIIDSPSDQEDLDSPGDQEELDSPSDGEDKSDEATPEPTVGLNIGNTAPDFELETLSGKRVKLSDYRGQRVMVNFWATWCPPCRAEMPDIQKFHQANDDIVILAINLTQTEPGLQQIQDFVDEFGLTFPVLLDVDIQVATAYQIRPIPSSFLIDSNGIIQFSAYGPLTYEMMVEKFEKMN